MRVRRSVFHSLGLCLILVACQASNNPPSQTSVPPGSELRRSLAAIQGNYTWNDDAQRYVFSHKAELETIISSTDRDGVLVELVGCLDDISASESQLNGTQVPVGAVCYEALSQLAYYEPTDPDGDIAESWPGHISPTATPEQLRAARQAWTEVLESKTYHFL